MADSNRLAALKDLYSALQTISVANGYATDVAAWKQEYTDWESAPVAGPLPLIGMVPGEATYEYAASGCGVLRVAQLVTVEFGFAAATQAIIWQTGDELVDDIIAAISVDRTRNGNAMDTRVLSAETDAGNADWMDSRGGTAAGLVRVSIDLTRRLSVS